MVDTKALLVAIDDYGSPQNNLNSCIADAEAMERLLGGMGFATVRKLYDGDATLPKVQQELDWLFERATPESRLFFLYSGHGHQLPQGEDLTEVLVLSGLQFLTDDELTSRSQRIPAGTLTVYLDSCFSGGMQKPLVSDHVEIVRTKVWLPDEGQQAKEVTGLTQVRRLKPFSVSTITDPLAVQEFLLPSAEPAAAEKSTGDEASQLQLNGMLLTACLENETASAASSQTDGKSAFTFAVLKTIDRLGTGCSPKRLRDEADSLLKSLQFRQTPQVFEPLAPEGLGARSFILMSDTLTKPGNFDGMLEVLVRRMLDTLTKEKAMTQLMTDAAPEGQVDEKFLGALGGILGSVVPAIIPLVQQMLAPQKAADFSGATSTSTSSGGEVDEKFFGALGGILGSVVPAIIPLVQQMLAPQK